MSTLYIVATPIGNLSDMSPHAIETLKSVSLIAAEDTRVTRKLTTHFGIDTPLISCHQHNEKSRAPEIVARMLEEDMDVAVVTDAGTPAISDPGVEIVKAAAPSPFTASCPGAIRSLRKSCWTSAGNPKARCSMSPPTGSKTWWPPSGTPCRGRSCPSAAI